jgi:hypothetical protein
LPFWPGCDKRRLRQDAEAWPVSADQFILFNNKIQGIGQRDTGIDMLLNDLFITERRIVKREAIVVFQQAGQQGLPDTTGDGRDDAARMKGDDLVCINVISLVEDVCAEGRSITVLCRGDGSGINRDINVAVRTERIGLAGQTFCIQRDAVLMTGIQFTAGEH